MIDNSEWLCLVTLQLTGLLLIQHYGTWHSQERPEAQDVSITSVSPIYIRTVSGNKNLQACPYRCQSFCHFPQADLQ